MVMGSSRARIALDSRGWAITSVRLEAGEEQVRDQQYEERVLDYHVPAERLLDRVPDDAAIHIPDEKEQHREDPFREVGQRSHGPGEEAHDLSDEDREEQRPPGRHRASEHPEGAVAGKHRDEKDASQPEREVEAGGQDDHVGACQRQRHERLLYDQVTWLLLFTELAVVEL